MSDEKKTTTEASSEEKAKQLPNPSGYKILIAIPQSEETFESGIIKADATRNVEEITTIIGFVLDMGPDAYVDKDKVPSGPWCKKGDFVLFRAYSGTRFRIHGKEFRLINDDSVEGIVDDPRGYTRA